MTVAKALTTDGVKNADSAEILLERVRASGKRVLIMGGSGYLGSRMVEHMQRSAVDFRVVDKRRCDVACDVFHCFDLCDHRATADCIDEFRPDYLVHCGTNSAGQYRDRFLESFKDDWQATVNILETLAKFPACRMIYFSSSYVYSGLETPVTETSRLLPSHNFGVAKAFFEQAILRHHPNTVTFRLSSVFGRGNATNPNAIIGMTREARETGQITVWAAGARMMQYVLIEDVLKYIYLAFDSAPGIYNLGGNEYVTTAEAARLVASLCGAKATFLADKSEGETLPFMRTEKLKTASGDHVTPFRDAVATYLKEQQGE